MTTIVNPRFMLPAADVAALRSQLSPAFRPSAEKPRPAPAAAAGPRFTSSRVQFGDPADGHFTERNAGSFASLGELLAAGGLAWEPQLAKLADDRGRAVDNVRVVRRSDNGDHLGVVSPSYAAISPIDAFGALLGPAIAAGVVTPDRCGLIQSRAFVQAGLALDAVEIVPGDTVVPKLTSIHTFDGKSATRAGFSPVRIVCRNTLAMSYRDIGEMGFTVTKRGGDTAARMAAIGDKLNLIAGQWKTLAESWRFMQARPFTGSQLRELLARVYQINESGDRARIDKLERSIAELIERGRGANLPGVRGTLWGAFNALTEHDQHEATVRGQLSEGDRRWERTLDGSAARFAGAAQVEVLVMAGATRSQAEATIRGAWE